MNFQRYRTFYALSLYSNNTHSAADFDGNSEAADIAGKLFDRWTAFDRTAASSGYENEQQVIEAEAAHAVYCEFTALFT